MRTFTLIATALLTFTALTASAQKTAPPPAAAPPAAAPAAVPAAATAIAAAALLTAEDVNAWLDGYLPYALQTGDIAGAVVAVVKDGKVVTERGYGFGDVEKRASVDPRKTLFRPGSTSKLFTWTAVMQLVEQGKLDLDKDVNTYLDFKIPDRDDGPITLRNIMTHTAGFEEQVKELILDDPKQLPTLKTYLEHATPVRLFKAGTTPAYSNYATALAG